MVAWSPEWPPLPVLFSNPCRQWGDQTRCRDSGREFGIRRQVQCNVQATQKLTQNPSPQNAGFQKETSLAPGDGGRPPPCIWPARRGPDGQLPVRGAASGRRGSFRWKGSFRLGAASCRWGSAFVFSKASEGCDGSLATEQPFISPNSLPSRLSPPPRPRPAPLPRATARRSRGQAARPEAPRASVPRAPSPAASPHARGSLPPTPTPTPPAASAAGPCPTCRAQTLLLEKGRTWLRSGRGTPLEPRWAGLSGLAGFALFSLLTAPGPCGPAGTAVTGPANLPPTLGSPPLPRKEGRLLPRKGG